MKHKPARFLDMNAVRTYAEPLVAMYPEPTLLLDNDLHAVLANEAFYRQFGISKLECEGRPVAAIGANHPGMPHIARLLERSEPERVGELNFEMSHPDPARGYWRFRMGSRLLEIGKGLPFLRVLTMEGADRRSRTEGASAKIVPMRAAEPIFRKDLSTKAAGAGNLGSNVLFSILENIPEAVIVLEAPSGEPLFASAVHERFTGLRMEGEATLDDLFAQFRKIRNGEGAPADRENFPACRSLSAGERVFEEAWQVRRADGRWAEISINASPVSDGRGNVTHAVLSWRDMSEQLQVEAELRRTEFQFRTLVENSTDIILRFDPDMRYLYVNTAFEQITGISRDRFSGRTNRELGMDEAHLEVWEAAAGRAMRKGRKVDFEFSLPGVFGRRHFLGRVIPEFGAAGRVETLMLIGRDVTERKQAEEHVRYISFHDAVTGLYNRAYFEAEIRRLDTLRSLPISIIIGDVNHLKLTNDTFGHREGDRLLASIGEILQSCCRDEDIIARWGGDEFAVILPKTSAETAAEICGRIHKSAEAYGEKLAIRPSIALGAAVKRSPEEDIFAVVSEAEEEMYDDKLAQSKKNRDIVIGSLLERVRRTWPEHEAHLSRSCDIADRFAAALGLSERELADLKLVILLHDIGKAAVPDTCLKKPGRLTVEEWEAVKRYPETGFRIAKSFAETARVSDEVLSLRERWDGTGYPRGLKGEEIPHLSRVFSIVDVYDILTHERPYAAALTHEQAVREIRKNAGKQFDPRLVETFTRSIAVGEKN